MRSVAQGDEAALEQLVERHAARLHGFLTHMSGDVHDAEDLLQETWIRIVRGARGFDPRRRFRPWAYRIAANLARDRRRRLRVRPTEPLTGAVEAPQLDPLVGIDVAARLGTLPASHREVLVLRYYQGLTESEIGEALGIPRGTVKSRTHHALRRLRGESEGLP